MRNMKADMENSAVEHAAALAGVHPAQEFQALKEESKRAREEMTCLNAELAVERSLRVAEKASREKAE